MIFKKTAFDGLIEILPQVYEDERGYFFETLKTADLDKFCNEKFDFIQENESLSNFGTLRGLHYQYGNLSQTKLVRVIKGRVLDVVLDLRSESKTFGKTYSTILDHEDKKQLLIPKGFAHGHVTLSPYALFLYKIDQVYSPEHERGINFRDPYLKINWQLDDDKLLISKRDSELPNFQYNKTYF